MLAALYLAGTSFNVPLLAVLAAIPLVLWSLKQAIKSSFPGDMATRIIVWLIALGVFIATGGILALIAGLYLGIYSLSGALRR